VTTAVGIMAGGPGQYRRYEHTIGVLRAYDFGENQRHILWNGFIPEDRRSDERVDCELPDEHRSILII